MATGKKETAAERKKRLAKALRANLKRRKAQGRGREEQDEKEPRPEAEDSKADQD